MFYENYLNSLKPDMSFIPESASFGDMAVFTNRAIQDSYNEAAISFISKEIAFNESVFNEADDTTKKKGFLETIKNFFKTIWEKIKGFFKMIFDKIKEVFQKAKDKKIAKMKEDFANGIKKLPSDFSVEAKVVDFDVIAYVTGQTKKVSDGIRAIIKKAVAEDLTIDDESESIENFKEKYSKKLMAKMLGFNGDIFGDDSTAKVALFPKFDIEKATTFKKAQISKLQAPIVDLVFDGKGWNKAMLKSYDATKKLIDDTMNDFKAMVNGKPKKGTFISALLSICKEALSINTKVVAVTNKMIKGVRSEYLKVVAKVISATRGKEDKDKKSVKEDTEITIDVEDQDPNENTTVDVKDEIEEAFGYLREEDEEEVEVDDVEVEAESATLYNAIVEFLS